MTAVATLTNYRDFILGAHGQYGPYGGMYVPEVIRPNMEEVAAGFEAARRDAAFLHQLHEAYRTFSGRPTPLTPLPNLSTQLGGAQVFVKNEGLGLTGAHKINHCLGQILLAKRLGKKRIIAETGAGQHGYATATVCARYGLQCTVYMGAKDYERQRPNVFWMELLGAQVVPVTEGSQTLNDAVIAAFKDLILHPDDTFYLLGSAVGPHPYPAMNTFFQKIVSEEMRAQCLAQTGKLPSAVLACVGGGSNACGAFFDFLDDPSVRLIGVEAGGHGTQPGAHAAKLSRGAPGVFEGYASLFLQDADGNIAGTSSISAGLDYCGVSPILAYLQAQGRLQATAATDEETLAALQLLARTEGIILALESAHALAAAVKLAPTLGKDEVVIVNGSGRGEKDLFITLPALQPEQFKQFMAYQLHKHDR
jgi:tryptophan synthase beta chain